MLKSNRLVGVVVRDVVIRVYLFLGFSTSRQTRNLKKIFRESRDPENHRDCRDSGNSRENVPELDHFDISCDFQHFRSYF